MATASLPPEPKPESAQQAVAMVKDDHSWIAAPPDVNSTDGIKKNIAALWASINRLAAYVDGDKTDAPVKPTATSEIKPAAPYSTTPSPSAG